MNGGALCWIVRVGDDTGRRRVRARRCRPRPTSPSRRSAPRRCRGRGRRSRSSSPRSRGADKDGDADLQARRDLRVETRGVRGPDRQEGPHEPRDQGQRLLEAGQDHRADRSPARGPERPATGSYTLSKPAPEPEAIKPNHFEGDVAKRQGMGGLAAVDEITMVCMPDLMTLAQRRRRPAARPPGQDDRPLRERGRPHGDPRRAAGPAPAGDPRVADEHRRLRLEDGRALLPVDRGHGSADQPADR